MRNGAPLEARHQLGWTDLRVSNLALGTMQFGWQVTDVGAFDLLDHYCDAGGNFIDTADMYGPDQTRRSWDAARPHVGVSEDVVGRWLAERHKRDEFVIATKVRARMWDGDDGEGLSRRHILRAVEDSLRRLRVETIDLYQAHWPDEATPLEECLGAFEELVRSGKVRYIGTSNYAGSGQLEEVASMWRKGSYPRLACEQPRFSLLNRYEYEHDVLPTVLSENLGVICYSPLAAGFLSGKYKNSDDVAKAARGRFLSQYAVERGWALLEALEEVALGHVVSVAAVSIAWLLAQPGVTAPIVGANSILQMDSWLAASALELDPQELALLDERSWTSSKIEFSSW